MLAESRTPVLTDWLGELYAAHFGAVFRLCRTLLWNREDAADATHDVFARAARLDGPFGTDEHSRAWLLAVARNQCVDVLRRRARLNRALLRAGTNADAAPDPERVTLDRQLVHQVLGQLSPRERRLLWQSAVEHRPVREIAAGLRLTQVAAAQALHRARKRAGAIAARIAGVIGLIRLRRPNGATVSLRDVLPLAIVPLLAVSMHSSTVTVPVPISPPALTARPTIDRISGSPASPVQLPSARPAGTSASGPASAVAPGAGSAITVATAMLQAAVSRDPGHDAGRVPVIGPAIEGRVPPLNLQTPVAAPTVQAEP